MDERMGAINITSHWHIPKWNHIITPFPRPMCCFCAPPIPPKGDLAGYWTVRVSDNWRIVFRFDGSDVRDVYRIDYH